MAARQALCANRGLQLKNYPAIKICRLGVFTHLKNMHIGTYLKEWIHIELIIHFIANSRTPKITSIILINDEMIPHTMGRRRIV